MVTKIVTKSDQIVTKSDLQNISNRVPCIACIKTFASKSSFYNHKKRCKKTMLTNIMVQKDIDEVNSRELNLLAKIQQLEEKVSMVTTNEYVDINATMMLQKCNPQSPFVTKTNENLTFNATQLQPICNLKSLLVTTNDDSQKVFICNYCNSTDFTYRQSLARHMKICNVKIDLERKNEELQKQVDMLLKDKDKLNKDKEILNQDKDKFADLATTNNNLIKTSISAMKYFMTNFKDAPALKSIEDLSTIKTDYNNTNFIKQLISMYRNENLAAYIGEYIVNIYKTNDSSKQTMWSSDVDRLTYIISEAVAKDKTTWVTDKKGITVGERVIRPALEYIKPLLQKFIMECGAEVMTDDTISSRRQAELIECQKLATHIVVLIDNKVLEKDIIKYIAPLLYWNKNALLDTDIPDIKVKVIEHVKKSKTNPVKKNNKLKSSKPVKNIKIINKPITEKKFIKQKNNKTLSKPIEYSSTDEDLVESDSD
jgi:hypothetical protein